MPLSGCPCFCSTCPTLATSWPSRSNGSTPGYFSVAFVPEWRVDERYGSDARKGRAPSSRIWWVCYLPRIQIRPSWISYLIPTHSQDPNYTEDSSLPTNSQSSATDLDTDLDEIVDTQTVTVPLTTCVMIMIGWVTGKNLLAIKSLRALSVPTDHINFIWSIQLYNLSHVSCSVWPPFAVVVTKPNANINLNCSCIHFIH